MKIGWRQRMAIVALAAGLGATPTARAQMPPFPVPVGPEVLVVPLLLLLLLPLGMKMAQTDEKTVRDLEQRGDWGAVVALADKRLAEGADALTWREIRGRALQRSGRCALAMPDLQVAFERRLAGGGGGGAGVGVGDAAFEVGLALGLCEMQAWQLEAAAGTMSRLAALAPARWEPPYNLAIIAAQRGDAVAADAAVAAVAVIDAARATALRRELAARPVARRDAKAAPSAAESAVAPARLPMPLSMHASVQLVGQHLGIGDRRLELPAGAWALASSSSHQVRGSTFRRAQLVDEVPLVTVHALATAPDGALAAALAFTTNPRRADGTKYWDGEDFCAVRDAIHVDRFGSSLDEPECVYVRLLDSEAARISRRLAPALAAASQAGMALPARVYEIHYSQYGQDWMVAGTWLLPSSRLAGNLAAVQWARDLAAQMAPLARRPDALPALVPPLGPGG